MNKSGRMKGDATMLAYCSIFSILLLLAPGSVWAGRDFSDSCHTEEEISSRKVAVSGSGVHLFSSSIVHSSEPTAAGMIQRSTDTVELSGDLTGRLLYHPVSIFDFVEGTLVNTGHQVFSGTILGSKPVMLHDDTFRFEVELATGATTGKVHLTDRLDGPNIRCHLNVVGTGLNAEGDATFAYDGECKIRPAALHGP
jgi:hypothetical protein